MIVSKDKYGYKIMMIPYDTKNSEVVIRMTKEVAVELRDRLNEILPNEKKD